MPDNLHGESASAETGPENQADTGDDAGGVAGRSHKRVKWILEWHPEAIVGMPDYEVICKPFPSDDV